MTVAHATGLLLLALAFPAAADPVLDQLVADSVAVRPELRAAEARARAAREQVPQAGAMPDPLLSLGIQNDGFGGIEIGTMETSFVSIMLTQPLPWPGKRGLRRDVARLGADRVQAGVARVRLGVEADVKRAYVDLLVARGRLALLDELEALWQKSEELARARYEVGGAPQSDILRAQLERARLRQRRLALAAEERTRVQALNRLRARPLDEPIATTAALADLPDPLPGDAAAELADAEDRSPELAQARLAVARAGRGIALARKDRYPDFSVSAGVMPRGDLEPMWTLGLSMDLPFLWGRGRRSAAIRERQADRQAEELDAETTAQLVRQRVAERRVVLAALLETLDSFRRGLLVQSAATVESTLSQYRVGKVSFASVLEALGGLIRDKDDYLTALADAQRVAIARAEVSLAPVAGGPASSMPAAAPAPSEAAAAPAMPAGGM